MKMLVEVELEKPLLRGTKLKFGDEFAWIEFRYEKLPTFYFYCGIVSHPEKNCKEKIQDSRNSYLVEGQYGEWMRV